MNKATIEEMVESIMTSFGYEPPINEQERLVQDYERERIREGIERCWKNKISTIWTIDDIISMAKEEDINLTKEQGADILESLHHNFDASIGINWSVIDIAIQAYLD